MTQWGMLLLCAYIALGATRRLTWRKAGAVALGLTVVVIAAVFVMYSTTTPMDKYIPLVDTNVYATGTLVQPPPSPGSNPNATNEDRNGIQPATWSSTDHSSNPLGTGTGGGADGGGG